MPLIATRGVSPAPRMRFHNVSSDLSTGLPPDETPAPTQHPSLQRDSESRVAPAQPARVGLPPPLVTLCSAKVAAGEDPALGITHAPARKTA